MTDTAFNTSGTHKDAVPEPGIRTILQWLELPLPPHPADELPSLRSHPVSYTHLDVYKRQKLHQELRFRF